MTAPAAQAGQAYGYAHRGTVTAPSLLDGYWMVRVAAINTQRPVGPYPSTVPDLVVGDRVLLTQIGTTRDDLVITGKLPADPWGSHLPIGIDDVTGLQAALDDRATDAELEALADVVTGSVAALEGADAVHDGRLDALETADTGLDSRLDTAEAGLVTLDGRATAIEGVNTTQDGLIAANTAAVATNTSAINDLNTWAWRNQTHDLDIYNDAIDFGVPRWMMTTTRSMGGGVGYITRTRVRRDLSISLVRLYVTTGGVGAGGLTTAAVYTSTSALGTYSLAASGTATLTGTGRLNVSVPLTVLPAGTWVLVLLTANGYSGAPPVLAGVGINPHATLINPAGAIVWATKGSVTSAPATLNPQDGTWSAQTAPWWVTLS